MGTFENGQVRKVYPGKTFVQSWTETWSIMGHSKFSRCSTIQKMKQCPIFDPFLQSNNVESSPSRHCRGNIEGKVIPRKVLSKYDSDGSLVYLGDILQSPYAESFKLLVFCRKNFCPNMAWSLIYLEHFSEKKQMFYISNYLVATRLMNIYDYIYEHI